MKNFIVFFILFFSTSVLAKETYKTIEPTDSFETTQDPFKQDHPFYLQDITFSTGINYFDGFGLRGRYAYRLVDNRKFIADFTNALFFEGGFGLTFYGNVSSYSNVNGFDLLATLRWDAQHSKDWTLFINTGFGVNFVSDSLEDKVRGGGFYPAIGIGAFYYMAPRWGARFDLSWQHLGFGLTYRF